MSVADCHTLVCTFAVRVSAFVAALASVAVPAVGSDLVVDSFLDGIDLDQGDGVCLGLADRCTLRAAIQEANALPGVQTIVLEAGVYEISIRSLDEEDAGATGDLDVTSELTIEGVGADDTVIDSITRDRIFDVQEGASLTLRDLTVTGGYTPAEGAGLRAGEDSFVFLVRTRFERNFAEGAGGGVALVGALSRPATLLAFGADFFLNVAGLLAPDPGMGGGIYSSFGSVHLLDTVMHANQAVTADALLSAGPVVIERSTIRDHLDANLAVMQILGSGSVRIENSTISGNHSELGIIITESPEPMTIRNSTIVENEADITIINFDFGPVRLGNSVLFNATVQECLEVDSLGHNAIRAGTEVFCGHVASDLAVTDPKLGPLAANGGETRNHLPLAGSPLLDAGDDESCLGLDQRGVERPQDGDGDGIARCDIGAVEAPEPGRRAAGAAALAASAFHAWRSRSRRRASASRSRRPGSGGAIDPSGAPHAARTLLEPPPGP